MEQCEYTTGEPRLRDDSEEALEMKEGVHFYNPVWVDLSEIETMVLFPIKVKEEIISKFVKYTGL